MRDIPQKYLDFGNDLLRRTERCFVDEICVSWRTLVMKYVWDGGSQDPLPGDVSINFNSVFDVLVDGGSHRIDIHALEGGDLSTGVVLGLVRKRVTAADLDRHRLTMSFENGWEIYVPLDGESFEPIIIWDFREPVDWLAL